MGLARYSTILFYCFAKEVLSRGISEFIFKKDMLPMIGPEEIEFPSHALYVNDIFVFCIEDIRTLQHLKSFLQEYDTFYDHWVSLAKIHFYIVNASVSFVRHPKRVLFCNEGYVPFTYLGVPIFAGRIQLESSVIVGL